MEFEINSPKYGIKKVLIDDEDYDKIKDYNWHVGFSKNVNNFYVKSNKQYKKIYLHRVIMGITDKKIQVDHVNHDTLNCKKSNLRICNSSENNRNRSKNKNNKTG